MNSRIISVCFLIFSVLVVMMGCAENIYWLAATGLILSIAAILGITIFWYEAPDTRGRLWGESVFNAAGRQISSGSFGFGVIMAVIFGALALACLCSGQMFGCAMFAFLSMTAANS